MKPENIVVQGRRITLVNLAVEPEEQVNIKINTQNIYDIYGRKLSENILIDSIIFPPAESYLTFHKDDQNFIMEAATLPWF